MAEKTKCNITSLNSTNFLAGVQLVDDATVIHKLASENWPYPTSYKLGTPRDFYYAEVWQNGMDWQSNFWYIETLKYEEPICRPLIIFSNHSEQDKLLDHEFRLLVNGLMYFRRNDVLIHDTKNSLGIHTDMFSFLSDDLPYRVESDTRAYIRNLEIIDCEFEHNSQENVKLRINSLFLPKK